jgi:hypothetical protein
MNQMYDRNAQPYKVGQIINNGRRIVTAVTWWGEEGPWYVETKLNPAWCPVPPETVEAVAAVLEWGDVADLVAGQFPLRVECGLNDKAVALLPPDLDLRSDSEAKAALVPRLAEAVQRLQPALWRRKVVQRQFDLRCAQIRAEQEAALKRQLAAIKPQIDAIKADPNNWRWIEFSDRLRDEDGEPYGGHFRNEMRALTKEAAERISELEEAARKVTGWMSYDEIRAKVEASMTPEERACL